MLTLILKALDGNKTYLAAKGLGFTSILFLILGQANVHDTVVQLLVAGAIAALRHALEKLPDVLRPLILSLIKESIERFRLDLEKPQPETPAA
jgi:hypothetical protein